MSESKESKVIPIGEDAWAEHEQLYLTLCKVEAWRAKKVFDLANREPEELVYEQDPITGKIKLTNPWADELKCAINEHLDFRSIGYFIDLVMNANESDRQRENALSRHAKNHAAKIQVFEWCDANMDRFKTMDDAAMDIAETFVPQKFRAVREWMTMWKKLRSASTP